MGLLNLVGRLSLDGAPFKQGLDKSKRDAQGAASDISNSLKGMVMGAVGGLTIATQFKEAADYAAKIVDASARLNMGTGTLQEIAFGASMAGSSLESLIPLFQKIAVAKREAIKDPSGDMADAFVNMGISIEELKSKRIEDIFYRIGGALESAGDSQEIFADALKITGKGAGEIVQMFRGGFSDAVEQFRNLDIAVSDEALRRVEAYGDKFTELGAKSKSAFTWILSGIASAHEASANYLDDIGHELDLVGQLLSGEKNGGISWKTFKMEAEASNNTQRGNVFGRDRRGGFSGGASLKSVMGGVKFEDNSNKEIGGIIKMQERINELKFSALTDDQKRPALLKQIEEYEMRIALIRAGRFLGIGGTPKDILQQELNIAEAQAKLAGLIKKDKTKELSPLKDSLTSVGNFLGANPNSGQMKEFSEMNRKLDAIVRNTARTGGSIFPQ
jgi:hypothetical protein